MMRIMKRNDPHNQNNMTQLARGTNKFLSENSRIVEENRGKGSFYFRYSRENLTAKAYDF